VAERKQTKTGTAGARREATLPLPGGGTVSCIMLPMIRVRLPQKEKEFDVPGPRRVMDILADAGVRPTTVIVTQGKKLLTRDHKVGDGETIEVISVVSGG
jgi:sulfur carrier protein